MNQKIILVLSLLIGLLAFGLNMHYLQTRMGEIEKDRRAFEKRVEKIEVVVAARDVPQGMILTRDDVARGSMYVLEVTTRSDVVEAKDARFVLGRKTLFSLKKGEAVNWSYLEGGGRAGPDLATSVSHNMRALSLSVGGAAAVSSMISPSDRVDVLGTFSFPSKTVAGEMETLTVTVLQDVTVLATGQRLANDSVPQQRAAQLGGYSTVTLEVTAREAELLVFAQQLKGRLTLTLRNPSDVSFEKDLPSVNFEKLEESLPELNQYRQRHIRHKSNP
ncbi:MAG: Flp pilus assembly protein CpaB [Verrucomicrobia bacterium]|nr:Flp pilus assembly protein CpaB [Verrucomicrobiota bacterium]